MRRILVVGYLLLTACALPNSTSQDSQTDSYTVIRGDTLYSIAWRYQLDHRELAQWNQIPVPYTIYPGQRLVLNRRAAALLQNSKNPTNTRSLLHFGKRSTVPHPQPAEPVASPPPAKPSAAKATPRPSTTHTVPTPAATPAKNTAFEGQWLWPTRGTVLQKFVVNDKARQGVDIGGNYGQTIYAAAAGQVVYSGNGLASYGNLIIIRHDETFLSAYAHNSKLLVREGETVRAGQQIAEMGRDSGRRILLHFEIRKHGKPVNPLEYLQP